MTYTTLMRTTVLACAGVILAANTYAATYYVDQTAGKDSNAGTSPTSAWQNSPGMAAYTGSGVLRPGDTVYFDRGDTWLVAGMQGLYLVGGVTYIGDSWGATGTRATIRASVDLDSGVVRFADHPTSPTIFQGFDVDANSHVTTGVDINHAHYVAPQTGATKRIQNCIVHNVASRTSLGQYKYGIIISDHGGAAGAVANVEVLDSVVHDVSRDAICLYPGDESADCQISNITVTHSEAYNTGLDPDYCCGAGVVVKGNVQNATIQNNYLHDVKGASVFVNSNETNHYPGVGPGNIHVRYNVLTNATVNGAIRLYDGATGGDPKDVKVYGNVVYNSTVNGGLQIGSDLKSTLNLLVYNNTFYNAPIIINSNSATVTTFEFRNNIVSWTAGVPLTDAPKQITAHNNNVYFRGGGTLVSSGSSSYSSSTLASYESTASSSDPLLKNTGNLPTGVSVVGPATYAPNADGLSLQPSSPAIDHGTTLASPYNSSVNSVARPALSGWDIGAYEMSGAPPAVPTGLRISGGP